MANAGTAAYTMDCLPSEIKSKIAEIVYEQSSSSATACTILAKLALANRAWNVAVTPLLYKTFEESMMDTEHIERIAANPQLCQLVEHISVSLLDLCRDAHDINMYTASHDMTGLTPYDFNREMAAVRYDLALSRAVPHFTNAKRLSINTCVWDSQDYPRSKYTLHSLLSFSPANITVLRFDDVEHHLGMMLISQFLHAIPGVEDLSVHIRYEGEYREVWQQDDFRWTTREHGTCVEMCMALAYVRKLKTLEFGDMCLAMNNPNTPSRGFGSALEHLSLGPQSSAGPIIFDILQASAASVKHIRLDPENLYQAQLYGSLARCNQLQLLHLDGLNADTDYPGTLYLFAGQPVPHMKLSGYVDVGSVIQWLRNGELPELQRLDVDVMGYVTIVLEAELKEICQQLGIELQFEAWPGEDDAVEDLEDFLG